MPQVSRRAFLQLTAGGGAALAGGLGIKSFKKLIPRVHADDSRPGVWAHYATTCRECPAGCGMLGRFIDGRVINVTANPEHPVNRGGLCARGQSSVQGLYNPQRLRQILHRGQSGIGWGPAISQIADAIKSARGRAAILSDLQTGTMAELLRLFLAGFDSDRLLLFERFNYEAIRQANHDLYGKAIVPHYRLDEADLIISLGADFLETWVSPVEFAWQFAKTHSFAYDRAGLGQFSEKGSRAISAAADPLVLDYQEMARDPISVPRGEGRGEGNRIGRFIYIGPRRSMTAGNADEFIQVLPGGEGLIADAIVREMGTIAALRQPTPAAVYHGPPRLPAGIAEQQISRIAELLIDANQAVVLGGAMVGEHDPAATVAAELNRSLGAVGKTVLLDQPHALSNTATMRQTLDFLSSLGGDDVLIIHQTDPVFTLPQAGVMIRNAGTVVYLGIEPNQTAELADWVLPIDSPLESWGDYEPYPGVHSIMQPTMSRLHQTTDASTGTRHAGDILLALAEAADRPVNWPGLSQPPADFRECLKAKWASLSLKCGGPDAAFDATTQADQAKAASKPARSVTEADEDWTTALRRGGCFAAGSAARQPEAAPPGHSPRTRPEDGPAQLPESRELPQDALPLVLWPSIFLFDGRYGHRDWLLEAPDPMRMVCWGSWVELHPETAKKLGVHTEDVVRLTNALPFGSRLNEDGAVESPVLVTDDIAPGCVGVVLGFGRDAVGANGFKLLANEASGLSLCAVAKTGRRGTIIAQTPTQDQHNRPILQTVKLSELRTMKPGDGTELILPLPAGYTESHDIYEPHPHAGHRWAMAIDLQRCIGCGACTVACYAENNVPVVGAEAVRHGREMAWLKVPPYRLDGTGGRVGWLPMLCQHCDAAPCEPVCPVYAAVHNVEGLNAQVYNRCIGTRYCSNNCPYKVRRFNWSNINWPQPLNWQLNPDVSVRCRGVMEKCTFCVQRIVSARLRAKRQGRPIADGEIVPACAQTCPAGAILFGDLMNHDSAVRRVTLLHPRRYHVLENLNTKPAIAYLRRIVQDH